MLIFKGNIKNQGYSRNFCVSNIFRIISNENVIKIVANVCRYCGKTTSVHYEYCEQYPFIIKVQLMRINTIVINIKCIWMGDAQRHCTKNIIKIV